MKKLTFLFCSLLLAALAQATIIHIPADYPTIQQGIDASGNGDTVLVSPGTYMENINYNGKNITVASLFLTTQNKAYIAQTIIDGNQAGSVVTFNYCYETTTRLSGFTIQNGLNSQGYGGGIYLVESSPTLDNLVIKNNSAYSDWGSQGGGIYCYYYSNPVLKNILITENSSDYGGGIYFYYSNPILENITITDNTATYGGGIYFSDCYPVFDSVHRCNIYQNTATYGSDLFNSYSYESVSIVLNKFTVKKPKSAQAYPLSSFTFDILQGLIPQEDILLFVSPDGEDNNNGLTVSNPMKTIHHALEVVNAEPIDLYDIYLLNGTYSPNSNGEIFPLDLPDYMGLFGESEEGVILDADSTAGVISISGKAFVEVSAITITGGYSGAGGGIYIYNSSPILDNLTITENTTNYSGWGITSGGGLYCYNSSPVLKDLSIFNNSARSGGGGIYFEYSNPVFDSIHRCSIYNNSAPTGSDLSSYTDWGSNSNISIVVDTFTVLYPKSFHASPLNSFSFDIQNGKVEQENIVLYASPEGNDNNSGLSESETLKTINQALGIANSDPINLYDIHLSDGIYSPSATGEVFPISLPDYLSLVGESRNGVILDAEGQSRVIEIYQSGSVEISNLTISGGGNVQNYDYGGGIYCYNSNPYIHDVNIQNNYGYYGGGMYLENCSPFLKNVLLSENSAEYGGGGIYMYSSNPKFENITLSGNTSQTGGGIYMYYSSPKFENMTVTGNTSQTGGGIYFGYNTNSTAMFDSINRCNIYLNNATNGSDLYADYFTEVVLDTFTVMKPTRFTAAPIENFSFDILHGKLPQAEADLYVSPDGDDMNSGLTPDEPIKTIRSAMIRLFADSLNQRIVNLMEGTFSPSTTSEPFPVIFLDYVSLKGAGKTLSILDAEETAQVINISGNKGLTISDMTVSGGLTVYEGGGIYIYNADPVLSNLIVKDNNVSSDYGYGGGIYCDYSSPKIQEISVINNHAFHGGGISIGTNNAYPELTNVIISENTANRGGGMFCSYYSNPALNNLTITSNTAESVGGGIYFENSSPVVENTLISENTAENAGGVYFFYANPVLKNVTVSKNNAFNTGGGLYSDYSNPVFDTNSRCNIYLNKAAIGKDLYSASEMQVAVDTFTVMHPKLRHAYPLGNFSFNILHGMIPQQDIVLFASPDGDDGNSGLSEDEPLKTIQHAIEVCNSDSVNLFTIQLKNGIYSPSLTGESFPVSFLDYGNLIGESMVGVILDAEGQSRVIELTDVNFGEITNLTVTGGNSSSYGGGISFNRSNADLKSLNIVNNKTQDGGGGIYMSGSNLLIQNTRIAGNLASTGGGLYIDNGCNPYLEGTVIFDNSAEYGGGIYFNNEITVFDSINRCNIFLNNADVGNDLCANYIVNIVLDTFTVLQPKPYLAWPLENFTFDILHAKIESVNANLYVSPNGDNNNSGLTSEDPLKTIRFATSIIVVDSLNPHTIYLDEGEYSHETTGDFFPVYLPDYCNLEGKSSASVILNGEGKTILMLHSNNHTVISGMTIKGGLMGIHCSSSSAKLQDLRLMNNFNEGIYLVNSNAVINNSLIYQNSGSGIYMMASNPTIKNSLIYQNEESGIYCQNSNPLLQNLLIANNEATNGSGGGLYLETSSPLIQNVTINENHASKGGGTYCSNSNPVFVNSTISSNIASYFAGGIYCGAGTTVTFINSIMWNDEPQEIMLQGIYSQNSVQITYSDIEGGEEGILISGTGTVNWMEGNINEDPVFVSEGDHPYQISDLSPCIDAGTPDTTGLNLPEYDLAGNLRFVNGRVDMGAYEWNIMVGQDETITGTVGFDVYPNPVKDFLFAEFSSRPQTTYLIEMYNTSGNVVKSVSGKTTSSENYQLELNTANLQPGLYFIGLQAGNQMATKKVVKL